MSKVRVESFAVSIDGYGAGSGQCREHPLGLGGTALHEWAFATRTFQKHVFGHPTAGETGPDDDFAARGFDNVGAWILGRNMFGPVRGPWPDESWKGWWGDEPPYHVPVYVLTHHPRPPLHMKGGTVFHFITDGIHAALEQAKAAAGTGNVRIGGGASTVRQYLQAGLIDEMHLGLSPVFMGAGEPLWHGLDMKALGYECAEVIPGERATHLIVRRRA